MNKITVEINGKALDAEQGQMIIEVADKYGVRIPRFCYHEKLSIAANCRMCLVQVEKSGKPLPACATPVTEGMKILTRSPLALQAQKAVMEFLLINHPLDCPICDQGGECELRDVSMGYGQGRSEYTYTKRSVVDPELGPLIETEMTRCIQCTRCVRFGTEISGLRELGAVGRGEDMAITTYIQKNIESELSGNMIDVCPVGALTDKPFEYKARAWEMKQHPMIAPHDCVGTHLYLHERGNQVMRAVPRACEEINELWISDRDRFSHCGINTQDRVHHPEIKVNGVWQVTDWPTALEHAISRLQKVLRDHGADAVAGLASSSETIENLYMMQAWLRGLGIRHIDHRLKTQDFSDQAQFPLFLKLDIPLADIEEADAILLIGSNLRKEQPLIWHRVHKAAQKGASVMALQISDEDLIFKLSEKIIADRGDLLSALKTAFAADHPIAKALQSAQKPLILMGEQALHHPAAAHLRYQAQQFGQSVKATVGYLTSGANASGADSIGFLPHRGLGGRPLENPGLNASQAFEKALKAYVVFNIEPPLDAAHGGQAYAALKSAEHVLFVTTHASPLMRELVDVILPAAAFSETSGSFVNIEGRLQSFRAAVTPAAAARPAWKIFKVLADLSRVEGLPFDTLEAITTFIESQVNFATPASVQWLEPEHSKTWHAEGLVRLGDTPIYAVDMITRRSKPLQETDAMKQAQGLQMHPHTIAERGFTEGELVNVAQGSFHLDMRIVANPRLPANSVFVAQGLLPHARLGAAYAPIEITGVVHG